MKYRSSREMVRYCGYGLVSRHTLDLVPSDAVRDAYTPQNNAGGY